ncbi:MAG: DNA repair protein RecN [Pseudomonadota bacterium]
MLTHISISQYTVIDSLDVDLQRGLTVITGETGAGKSIMLDALGLCLGDRADSTAIRPGSERADLSAAFDLSEVPNALSWLQERALDRENQCLIRRVITREGRSRAFINGTPATLQDCASLGSHLVDIYSQHAHQSLLRRAYQRALLDNYANLGAKIADIGELAGQWRVVDEKLSAMLNQQQDKADREQLLRYQVDELDELAISSAEIGELETEQKTLSNAGTIQQQANTVAGLCDDYESGVRRAAAELDSEVHSGEIVGEIRQMLDTAAIHLEEAGRELERYLTQTESNPERLSEVTKRLDQAYAAARKHRVKPEELEAHHRTLAAELASLDASDEHLQALRDERTKLEESYAKKAKSVTASRKKAAKKLVSEVEALLKTLSMGTCRFSVELAPRPEGRPSPAGQEDIDFLIATAPGATPQNLAKVASGGELSRISLAIQVATASEITVPSMVFDEVDVGIGGGVAEVVGRLLASLGASRQVLCVTHLPQVAAQGIHHLQVEKSADASTVASSLRSLREEERVHEIARMLGGIKMTKNTLAHAKEMLEDLPASR